MIEGAIVWLMVAINTTGAAMVAWGRPHLVGPAQVLWVGGNFGMLVHNVRIGEWAQAAQFAVFFGLAWVGVFKWRKRDSGGDGK